MIGETLALTSAVLASTKDSVSKRLSARLDPVSSTFFSFAGALPWYAGALILAWLLGLETLSVTAVFFVWIAARALSDAGAESAKMAALDQGDLSLVSGFLALSPIVALIVSPILTGDLISYPEYGAVLLVAVGGAVMYGFGRAEGQRSGRAIGYAILSALFFSLNSCFDRLAVRSASPLLSAAAVTLGALIVVAPSYIRSHGVRPVPPSGSGRLVLVRGGLDVVFMVLKLTALQYLSVPTVMAFMRASLLLNVLMGRVVFKEERFIPRLIGSSLMVVGMVLLLVFG